MTQDWYREYYEIGNNISPVYKVRVSDSGVLIWFLDFNKLKSWVNSK
jgi:hypothetical protein